MLAAQLGLVVLGEPDLAPGDARIEWADGGVVRERARILEVLGVEVRLGADDELLVGRLPHELDELGRVGAVDRLAADVRAPTPTAAPTRRRPSASRAALGKVVCLVMSLTVIRPLSS